MTEDRLRTEREAIGNVIREARQEKGLSLRELGDRIGLKYTYIGTVERGVANVTIDNLNRITEPLGLKVALTSN